MNERKWFVPWGAILACALWSTAFAAIKEGLKYSSPFSFAGIRFIISGLMLAPFWIGSGKSFESLIKNYRLILKICFFQTFLLYGLFYWGMTMVPAAIGAIITGSSPLVTAVVAHMFMSDDKMNPAKTLSLIIGVMGISIISFDRNPLTWNGMTHFAGIILVALAVLSSAFGNIIIAKNKNSADPLLLNSVQLFLGGLFLLILGVSIEGTPKILDQPPIFYGALLWLSFLSAAAFSIWFILLKKYNAKVSYLNMWKFIVPALGALLSWVLLPEEKATLPQIIGIACVTASIMMCNRAYSKA